MPGFDRVLSGGLRDSGTHLILGEPGIGKTILAHQIAAFHARRGTNVVIYLTALSENHRTLLELAGYEVLLASDGQQALEIARQQSPDVILLDVMMPRLDGREVARRIRRHDIGDDTTIILFSALDEADVEWQEVGAYAFHTKKEMVHIDDFIEDVIAS